MFLSFLQTVDFVKISISDDTWFDLIACLRFVANQSEAEDGSVNELAMADSEQALELFADIIAKRPYDTSRIMAFLRPSKVAEKSADLEGEGDTLFEDDDESKDEIDLADFGANKATDIFILKFLLCNKDAEKQKDSDMEAKKKEEEDEDFTITDKGTARKYAITSYLKLLTTRVLRLEQELAKKNKVSLIMVGNDENEDKADVSQPES